MELKSLRILKKLKRNVDVKIICKSIKNVTSRHDIVKCAKLIWSKSLMVSFLVLRVVLSIFFVIDDTLLRKFLTTT